MRGIQVTTCRICRKCGTLTHNKCCLCDDCYDKFKTGWAVSQNGKSASQRGYGYFAMIVTISLKRDGRYLRTVNLQVKEDMGIYGARLESV